jgi:hypothetical protein
MVHGWGVTDANSTGCYCHTAKVTTTIRSPKGRTQTASDIYGGRGHEYARADVSLVWDGSDLGNYTESSTHWAFCPYCNCYFINAATTQVPVQNGISYICWVTPVDTGGGFARYTRAAQCNVTCAPSAGTTKEIFTAGPPHPPTEVGDVWWWKIYGTGICGPSPWTTFPAVCTSCWQIQWP